VVQLEWPFFETGRRRFAPNARRDLKGEYMLELFQPAEGQTVTESGLIMRFSSDQVWIMDRMTARWAVFDRQGMLRGCSTPITVGILQHLEQGALCAFEGSPCQH
jgi:hypothetical protein